MNNYPFLKKKNLIPLDLKKNIYWAENLVNKVQNNNKKTGEVFLSFYPIAKNIRFLSSYMTENILKNKKSIISSRPRQGEKNWWEKNLGRGPWFPWLWARSNIKGLFMNNEGWYYYFDSFKKNINFEEHKEVIEPKQEHKIFYIYLACLKYTFQLNEQYKLIIENYSKKLNWKKEDNVLAVQIRRGETCTISGKKSDRPYYTVEQYIECIEELLKNNIYDYIYISTDGNEVIEELKEKKPSWKLKYLDIDRNNFFRMDENALPKKDGFTGTAQDLEDSCRLNPERIPFIVESGIADLYFISQCKGYIATISVSEFSRCGWFLQIATQGYLTPYININDKDLNMNERDVLLLK